jgi:hypothetical protein
VPPRPLQFSSLLTFAALAALAGCAGDNRDPAQPAQPASAELRRELGAATRPQPSDFPVTEGRTLQQLADQTVTVTGPEVGLATSVYTPGRNRMAFGVIAPDGTYVYGRTAVYLAERADTPARGPYLAPADLLLTDAPFRSRQAAGEDDPFAAIYAASVTTRRTGRWQVLVLTRQEEDMIGSQAELTVTPRAGDPVAKVGSAAPVTDTDTVASAGSLRAIDTRIPHDQMHDDNLRDVLGRRPAVVLFATPQLCRSRVCGPVTDIAAQLEQVYGDRAAFIHQEVYRGNDPQRGLRAPLRAFGLETEPWLFTIDRRGRIAARLEGSFGFNEMKAAIEAAIAG